MIFSLRRVCRCDASERLLDPCASGDRRLGKDPGRPRRSRAACWSRRRVAGPIAVSTSSGNAWRYEHSCGFVPRLPAHLHLRRRLAKASVSGPELKSRPRPGAICRTVATDPSRDLRSEPLASHPDAFIRDNHAPLRQQILPIAQAEGKPMVRPDGIGDDGPREPEALQASL